MNRLQWVLASLWGTAIIFLFAHNYFFAAGLLLVVLVTVLMIDGFSAIKPHIAADKKRRRECAGLCLHCGYSLQGNRSGRCPECGKQTN